MEWPCAIAFVKLRKLVSVPSDSHRHAHVVHLRLQNSTGKVISKGTVDLVSRDHRDTLAQAGMILNGMDMELEFDQPF